MAKSKIHEKKYTEISRKFALQHSKKESELMDITSKESDQEINEVLAHIENNNKYTKEELEIIKNAINEDEDTDEEFMTYEEAEKDGLKTLNDGMFSTENLL